MGISEALEKVRAWHLFLLAFAVFAAFTLLNTPPGVLTGDEVFYYFQAQHMKQGELVWFAATQPVLTSAVLALYPITDTVMLKLMFSSLMFSFSAAALYILARKTAGQRPAVMAVVLFIAHKSTITMAGWLYTEALFVPLLLISFILFTDIVRGEKHVWKHIVLGITMGLAMQTRVIGLLIPLFFAAVLLSRSRKNLFNRQFMVSLSIAGILSLLYIVVGSTNFLTEKSGGVFLLTNATRMLYAAPGYLTWPFLALFVLSFLLKHNDREMLFVYFIAYYLLLLSLISNQFFPRYLYIVIPFMSLLSGRLFFNKTLRYAAFPLFIACLFITLQSAHALPGSLSQNYYTSIPEGCQQVSRFNATCTGNMPSRPVRLPFFAVPVRSTCTLSTTFFLNESKETLYLGYIDDYGTVAVDNEKRRTKDMWEPTVFRWAVPHGTHSLSIQVTNGLNIGGVGQVLLCGRGAFTE